MCVCMNIVYAQCILHCACECALTYVQVEEDSIGCWFLTCGWRIFMHGPAEDRWRGH